MSVQFSVIAKVVEIRSDDRRRIVVAVFREDGVNQELVIPYYEPAAGESFYYSPLATDHWYFLTGSLTILSEGKLAPVLTGTASIMPHPQDEVPHSSIYMYSPVVMLTPATRLQPDNDQSPWMFDGMLTSGYDAVNKKSVSYTLTFVLSASKQFDNMRPYLTEQKGPPVKNKVIGLYFGYRFPTSVDRDYGMILKVQFTELSYQEPSRRGAVVFHSDREPLLGKRTVHQTPSSSMASPSKRRDTLLQTPSTPTRNYPASQQLDIEMTGPLTPSPITPMVLDLTAAQIEIQEEGHDGDEFVDIEKFKEPFAESPQVEAVTTHRPADKKGKKKL